MVEHICYRRNVRYHVEAILILLYLMTLKLLNTLIILLGVEVRP